MNYLGPSVDGGPRGQEDGSADISLPNLTILSKDRRSSLTKRKIPKGMGLYNERAREKE